MNDMQLEVFYLKDGQEVNMIVFRIFMLSFFFIIGAGARDLLKNVTDNHCSTLYVINFEFLKMFLFV